MKVEKKAASSVKDIQYIRDGRAPIPAKEAISKVMSHNKAKNTRPELALRTALWRRGIRGYRLHWKNVPGRPDIAYTKKKVAVFVNGCYWHRCPYCKPHVPQTNTGFWNNKFAANVERDQRKNDQLKELNWTVITIWECQLKRDWDEQTDKVFKACYD
jgi:DNA mismatch endonuclease, patch repair protein